MAMENIDEEIGMGKLERSGDVNVRVRGSLSKDGVDNKGKCRAKRIWGAGQGRHSGRADKVDEEEIFGFRPQAQASVLDKGTAQFSRPYAWSSSQKTKGSSSAARGD
uniref:Uncharacterized protein n=1 Tax=Melanopsichium pennsylvanicum 4 TaxID=1398559 RepID=A0A077R4I0_9BASI|nr:uncharacterized protein BN887_06044 [Melanopsichium pennsylvanicum 4]